MSTNSWQNLPQAPCWTKQRVRRYLFKTLIIGIMFCLIGYGIKFCQDHLKPQPFKYLEFTSNGAIEKSWFISHVPLPWGKNLLSIPLENLQTLILKHQQIETVYIQRVFPHTLKISLHERKPCAKILITHRGKKRVCLIANDGTLFQPIGYNREVVRNLCTVVGVHKSLFSHNKILGFDFIADLIDVFRTNVPDLLHHIKSISLAHFDPFLEKKWHFIDIQLMSGIVIEYPLHQADGPIKKLKAILHSLSEQQRHSLKRINLTAPNPIIEFYR